MEYRHQQEMDNIGIMELSSSILQSAAVLSSDKVLNCDYRPTLSRYSLLEHSFCNWTKQQRSNANPKEWHRFGSAELQEILL